jgi:nucleoside-diphosphate-sugar epimerase
VTGRRKRGRRSRGGGDRHEEGGGGEQLGWTPPGPRSGRAGDRLLVTGGSGAIGSAFVPLARAQGYDVDAPGRIDLDLFDREAVSRAVAGAKAVVHLATRIRPLEDLAKPELWRENDRLRADASRILVDAALSTTVSTYIQPTVTFVYPDDDAVDEDTPVGQVAPILRSALAAEVEAARFAAAGRRGVVLRFGLLDGPRTGHAERQPALGATIHVEDAARALIAALSVESGIYNVCRDQERVSNGKFERATGWRPHH